MYNYDDFYDNYSEFDCQIEEFKQGLIKGVKSKYIEEIQELREENSELQSIKKEFENIKRDYQSKVQELENEKKKLAATRAKDLLEKCFQEYYYPYASYRKKKKCDKCDIDRHVSYVTPLGRNSREECDVCGGSVKVLVVKTTKCSRVYAGKSDLTGFYRFEKYYEDSYDVKRIENIITDESQFDSYKVTYDVHSVFETFELCRKYCALMNKDIDFDDLEPYKER